jgi:hypothetical protein
MKEAFLMIFHISYILLDRVDGEMNDIVLRLRGHRGRDDVWRGCCAGTARAGQR